MGVALLFLRRAAIASAAPVTPPPHSTLFVSTRTADDALLVAEGTFDRATLEASLGSEYASTGFHQCRSSKTLVGDTDAKATRGLLVGATDCGDLDRLAEFHAFYDGVHAREVIDTGLYWRCRRVERIGEDDGATPRFFALYDTDGEEPATYRALRTRPMTTDWPSFFLVRSVTTYRRA